MLPEGYAVQEAPVSKRELLSQEEEEGVMQLFTAQGEEIMEKAVLVTTDIPAHILQCD